jgi:hypothetical protein
MKKAPTARTDGAKSGDSPSSGQRPRNVSMTLKHLVSLV